jgi:hypothetical protein
MACIRVEGISTNKFQLHYTTEKTGFQIWFLGVLKNRNQ